MTDLNSWEDEQDAQDDSLARQTQQRLNMGNPAQSNSFQPGAATFQPGAQNFQPAAQLYNQQYQQYQQGYGQQPYYPQYGQQPYGQYNQGYNYNYQQPYTQQQPQQHQIPQQPQPQGVPMIAKRGESLPQAPAQPTTQTPTATNSSNGTAAPKAKVLSISGDAGAASKPKVLSIGSDASTKLETGGKTKVLSIGSTAAKGEDKAIESKAADAGSKTVAAKAIEKTGEPGPKTSQSSGKTSPSPSSGRNSPTAAEKKVMREADAVAKEQEAVIDEETLREMYGKEHVNVIFLGHVDAGKSTLGGSILVSTGMVDERTLDKYKRESREAGRESWFLSWVLDLNKEERAKGKTVEVGRGFFETAKRRYSILDAPGHKTFVPNMIGGASQADVGVLVISARKGEYETGFEKGGQTREHAILAKTQGVNRLIVVVNKMDDPTVEWSEERYKQCTSKLSGFLKGVGYNPSGGE
jgi:peptide chain release factor subunit 3